MALQRKVWYFLELATIHSVILVQRECYIMIKLYDVYHLSIGLEVKINW